jgi:hypothetical protein
MTDRALAARIRVMLLSDERTRDVHHEEIDVRDGVVRIVSAAPESAEHVVRGVDGVRSVHAETRDLVLPPSIVY